MKNNITIVDYGMGNIHSVYKKLHQLNCNVTVTNDSTQINAADKIILPGVGHFGKAMQNLQQLNLLDTLHENVLTKQKPILGICLGMQLMCSFSEEGNIDGLGWFDTQVTRLKVNDPLRFKVPHTGWNAVEFDKETSLFRNIPNGSHFYFVHAFHVKSADEKYIMTKTTYETPFVSGLYKDNIFAVQFHPEKSHKVGEQLIQNFITL